MARQPAYLSARKGPALKRAAALAGAIVVLIAFCAELYAQQHYFRHYGDYEGLSQLDVRALLQDQKGFIWAGTEAGLNRYDGNRFEVFHRRDGLVDSYINDLAEAADGTIWIATNRGVSAWSEKTGFIDYSAEDGPAAAAVRSLEIDGDSRLWAGTRSGLCRLDATGFRCFTEADGIPESPINDLRYDSSGRLWIATDAGLYEWNNRAFRSAGSPSLPRKPVRKLAVDSRDRLIVGLSHGVHVLDDGVIVETYDLSEHREHAVLLSLAVGQDDTIYFGTERDLGIIGEGSIRYISRDDGLPLYSVRALMEDRDRMLWLGGPGGLARFAGSAFRTFTTADGLASDVVRPILRDRRGDLWVGTLSGLNRYDGTSWHSYTTRDGLAGNFIWSLLEDRNGTIWIGTDRGLNFFDGERIGRAGGELHRGSIRHLAEDAAGTLWVSVAVRGLYRSGANGYERVSVPDQTFPNARLLADSRGTVWASGAEGLSRWDGRRWKTFRGSDGLAGSQPYYIAESPGDGIWFGYHDAAGVTHFDGERFRTYAVEDGLAAEAVYSVGVDADANIWIGTSRGVDRFDGSEFINYGPGEGYAGMESNAGGFFKDHDGTLWFGTAQGLIHYDPRKDVERSGPPQVHVQRVSVDETVLPHDGGKHVLDGYGGDLRVRVMAPTYLNEDRLSLHYRLIGHKNGDWQALTGRDVVLPNVPAGMYRLEVRGRQYGQTWSEPAHVLFVLKPPLFQRAWFRLLLIIAVLAAAILLHRHRMLRTESKRRELEELVATRTSLLRSQRGRLKRMLSELQTAQVQLQCKNLQLEQANRIKDIFLHNMSHEIRTPLTSMLGFADILVEEAMGQHRDFATAILRNGRRLYDTLDVILELARLEDDLLEVQFEHVDLREVVAEVVDKFARPAAEKGLALRVVTPPYRVEGEVDRRATARVLEMIIGNAVKFTATGSVKVEAGEEVDGVWLRVTDTGAGISPSFLPRVFEPFEQESHGFDRKFEGCGLGLTLARGLVGLMGGSISCETTQGHGTTFTVLLPASSVTSTSKLPAEDVLQLASRSADRRPLAGVPAVHS